MSSSMQYPATRESEVIYVAPTPDQDRALIRAADQITHVGDVARWKMYVMSQNLEMAHNLAAEALVLANSVLTQIPQTERSQEYLQALTHDFLQELVELTSATNNEIKAR